MLCPDAENSPVELSVDAPPIYHLASPAHPRKEPFALNEIPLPPPAAFPPLIYSVACVAEVPPAPTVAFPLNSPVVPLIAPAVREPSPLT